MSVSDHYCRSVLQRMSAQMRDEPYEDAVVEVRGKNFFCHRFVLSACSLFFRALFRSGMSEAVQQMVTLEDMEPDTFQLILDSIYGGRNIVTKENVITIWQAATLLQIDFLQDSCVNFLMRKTNKENCMDVYITAKHLDSEQVSSLAWRMILEHFEYLVETEDIFMLDALDMEELVRSDDLHVRSEDMVINAIKDWIKLYERPVEKSDDTNADYPHESNADKNLASKAGHAKGIKSNKSTMKETSLNRGKTGPGAPENKLASFLGASRLCLVSAACLQELIGDSIVIRNPTALGHVQNALRFHLQPERRYDFCPSTAVYRSEANSANVLLSISSPTANNRAPVLMGKRSPKSSENWHTLFTGQSSYSIIHDQCNAVAYGNSIFGTACDVPRNLTFMFQYSLQANNTIAFAMIGQQGLKHRVNHSIVCHGQYLYIVGGDNGERSIDRFDLAGAPAGQWETVGELLQPVSSAIATVMSGLIIVIGNVQSEDKNETTSLIQSFDPQTMATNLFVDTVPRASEKRVFVKHWSEVYLLQESGDFWRLYTPEDKKRLHLVYQGRLWNSRVDITSAIIYKEELIVLAQPEPPAPAGQPAGAGGQQAAAVGQQAAAEEETVPSLWKVPDHELFKSVQILREDRCCLMTTVLPSALIPKTN